VKALALGLVARGGTVAGLILAAAVLTLAGLVWLSVSSSLIAAGARIDRLHHVRATLLESRAEALVAYARATDPRVLEHRAAALGLGPVVPDGALALRVAPSDPAEAGGALGALRSRRLAVRRESRTAAPSSAPLSRVAAAGVAAVSGD